MAVSFSNYTKKPAICLLILIGLSCYEVTGQKNLSGNVKNLDPERPYSQTHVKTIGTDRVTVDDISAFAKGDTVLLIQMQGVGIITDPAVYGNFQESFGFPGMHEFLIIHEVNAPDEIVFRNYIFKAYDAGSNIQIVRVPYFNAAKVTGKLFCDPWNSTSKKGGVMAIIVGRTLDLVADIDVSSLGLNGGPASTGDGRCSGIAPVTDGATYSSIFTNAGYKGEGLAIHDRNYALLSPGNVKGERPNYTGGGGGNGKYSGGGGGSNRGSGGRGGYEDPSCLPSPRQGGMPGKPIDNIYLGDRIILGGGGGGSTSMTGTVGAGGNGGGIVIIVADTVLTSGGRIIADGATGANGSSTGGAGGGGGGGSIAIQATDFGSATLTLSARGGNGGTNASFGSGGGGGGGLVYISHTSNVAAAELSGGQPGLQDDATGGITGEKRENFKVILNGFLFNSIRSSVTGDQTDSICSNGWPAGWRLTGTTPIGGTPGYTYTWQKKYDDGNWTTLVSNGTSINYTPTVTETDTVYFRRIVSDSSLPVALSDTSKEVKVIVQTMISGNNITPDSTLCYGQDPSTLISRAALKGGNRIYSFNWELSSNNVDFSVPDNTNDTESYTPMPALTAPTYYRRTVTSGRCIDFSAISFIDVLDTIKMNRIFMIAEDSICYSMTFDNLMGSTTSTQSAILAGGDGVYLFRWEASINGSPWSPAPGTIDQADYDPAELSQRIPFNEYIFRRVTWSGPDSVCFSSSNAVVLKDFPLISNNIVSAQQEICSGTAPALLTGSTPVNGDGTYRYEWQDSSKLHDWTNITGATARDFQPPALTDTSWYRRNVYSAACFSTSNTVMIAVHKPVADNMISLLSLAADTTICNNQDPNKITGTVPTGGTGIPGGYLYQWLYSTDNTTFNPVATGGTGIEYDLPALTVTTYYKRQVTSGRCVDRSASTVTVTVLPKISGNNISSSQTICYNTVPSTLTGSALTGGAEGSYLYQWEQSADGGISWALAAGVSNTEVYSPGALTAPMKYRRIVTSGPLNCCFSLSNSISISIHPPLPTAKITNTADTTICGGSPARLKIRLTGTAPWTVTYVENSTDITRPAEAASGVTADFTPASPLPLNTYIYTLGEVRDGNGCFANLDDLTGSKAVNVYKVPVAFAGDDTSVCGTAVTLRAIPTIGTGSWTIPADVASPASGPVTAASLDPAGFVNGSSEKIFTWQENNGGCVSSDNVRIKFYKQVNEIFGGNDTTFYTNTFEFHLKNDPPANAWEQGLWTQNGAEVDASGGTINDLKEGDNSFMWTIYNGIMSGTVLSEGCSLSDVLNIKVTAVFVPEGFSPNNDDWNNTFRIDGLDLPNQATALKIVNSVGTEVFSTYSTPGNTTSWKEWDGKSSGGNDLPEGTYYYFLTIGKDKFKGFIILKRGVN